MKSLIDPKVLKEVKSSKARVYKEPEKKPREPRSVWLIIGKDDWSDENWPVCGFSTREKAEKYLVHIKNIQKTYSIRDFNLQDIKDQKEALRHIDPSYRYNLDRFTGTSYSIMGVPYNAKS